MKILYVLLSFALIGFCVSAAAQDKFETDEFKIGDKNLKITFIGHGTLMFDYGGKIIHVDPYGRAADYSKQPKADLILITHEHGDHLDAKAVELIRKAGTKIVLNENSEKQLGEGIVMKNGDTKTVQDLRINAVPAYNIVNKRENGGPYHPKGIGNGYVITFGTKKIYIGGDTENIPEMKNLEDIYIAFLPMNLPYTMTPEMTASAARSFKPEILYPYHFGETDTSILIELLKDEKGIEIRIRDMK